MKALLLLFLMVFNVQAVMAEGNCKRSEWDGDFYFDFEDSREKGFTVVHKTEEECLKNFAKLSAAAEGKKPVKICACDSQVAKSIVILSLGAAYMQKYVLICTDVDKAGKAKQNNIDSWVDHVNGESPDVRCLKEAERQTSSAIRFSK